MAGLTPPSLAPDEGLAAGGRARARLGGGDTWVGIWYFAGGHLLAKLFLPFHLPLISAFQSFDSLTPAARIAGNIQSCILSRQG